MIKVDEEDPIGELEASFPYRDVKIRKGEDVKKYYDLEGELGRGKFGTVYKCKEKGSKLILAAKFIHIERRQDRQNVEREVEIMRTLQHPRLIQLYDAFESDNIMCVVLELIEGGELFERVIDDDFILTEKACTAFMRQICEGVEFIHRNNIIHLDLKPENILCLTKTGNRIKIIDFGLARKYEPDKKLQVLFGTPEFVAPEVVNFEQISFGTDMWSVGVICYVLLSGLSPFMGDTDLETMSNVTLGLYDFEDESFDDISADAKDFISKLLVKNQKFRMRASECLAHPWMKKKHPKKPMPCLEPTKDKLKTYVDNFIPHDGMKFINNNEESEKKFLNHFKDTYKQNTHPTFSSSLFKDSLERNKDEISNDIYYPKRYPKPLQTDSYKRNWAENLFKDNMLPYDIYNEKAVRHKLTLTPIERNLLLPKDNNTLLVSDQNSGQTQKLIDDLSGFKLNDSERKTNIETSSCFNENESILQQNNSINLDESNRKVFDFDNRINVHASSPMYSTSFKQMKSYKPDINDSSTTVKQSIIIPTIFSEHNNVNSFNQNLEIIELNLKPTEIRKEEKIDDINMPDLFIKMVKPNEPQETSECVGINQVNNLQIVPVNNAFIKPFNQSLETSIESNLELPKSDILKEEKISDINRPDIFIKMAKSNEAIDTSKYIGSRFYINQVNNSQMVPINNIPNVNSFKKSFNQSFETSIESNHELTKSEMLKDEKISDINRPDIFIKIVKPNEPQDTSEYVGSTLNINQLNHSQMVPINNIPIKNNLRKHDQKFGGITLRTQECVDKDITRKVFDEESKEKIMSFHEFKGRKKSINTLAFNQDLLTAKVPASTEIMGSKCKNIMAVPPFINITDVKRTDEQKDTNNITQFYEKSSIINMHRNSLDNQYILRYRSDTLTSTQQNEQVFLKAKLKSTPPWFSEMQKPNIPNDIPQRRSKHKFSIINRDVPLGAPIKTDIEKYLGIKLIKKDSNDFMTEEQKVFRRSSYNNMFNIISNDTNLKKSISHKPTENVQEDNKLKEDTV